MTKIYIGIDPDIEKSGVAHYNGGTKLLILHTLTFFELFEYLKNTKEKLLGCEQIKLTIVIEGGWLNKSNWHSVRGGSEKINAKIGSNVGKNHEVGKKIVEMCQYLKLNYEVLKPTKSKVDQEYFKKLTGIKTRTNQEKRDAAMLVWGR